MAQPASDEINGIPVWEIALAIGSGTLSVLLIAYAIYLARCKRRRISATTDVETGSDVGGSSASKPATTSAMTLKRATTSAKTPASKPTTTSAERSKRTTTPARTPASKPTPSVVRPVIVAQEEADSMIKGATKRAVEAIGTVAKRTVGRRDSAPGRVERKEPAKLAKPVKSKSNVRVGGRI